MSCWANSSEKGCHIGIMSSKPREGRFRATPGVFPRTGAYLEGQAPTIVGR